jgi:hypothetical protein
MHRRSFIAALIGGTAALTGGAAFARSTPVADAAAGPVEVPAAALDQADAEFTHMPPGPRWRGHRAWHRRNRRARRRWRRRVWRGGRWRYYW